MLAGALFVVWAEGRRSKGEEERKRGRKGQGETRLREGHRESIIGGTRACRKEAC